MLPVNYGAATSIDDVGKIDDDDSMPDRQDLNKRQLYFWKSWVFTAVVSILGYTMITSKTFLLGASVNKDDPFDPKSVKSPDDIFDGRWNLVRCVSSNEKTWHPATDNLRGTDQYGNFTDDYRDDATFTVPWDNSDVDMFLFALTDFSYWLVTLKDQVFEYGSPTSSTVLMSSASANPYLAAWYNREGTLADPWVSVHDHDADVPGIVYGENRKAGHLEDLGSDGRGACVWVR